MPAILALVDPTERYVITEPMATTHDILDCH
jgi:hypothetical protein